MKRSFGYEVDDLLRAAAKSGLNRRQIEDELRTWVFDNCDVLQLLRSDTEREEARECALQWLRNRISDHQG